MSPVDLNAEMARALRFARALPPPVILGFAEQGFTRRIQWGFARVDFYGLDGRLYEPAPDGRVMAFIVPVVEGGELIDLCAIDPDNQHVGTRLGYGHGLGFDTIERARTKACDIGLYGRPLDWLRDPVDTVYLFNLAEADATFQGIAEITCASAELADRLRAYLPPSRRSIVLVPP